jgi:hypothetical protein
VLTVKRGSRRIALKNQAADLRAEKELLGFLSHKFEIFAGCDVDCDCTRQGGAMCGNWYTCEGEAGVGGVGLTRHCVTTLVNSETLKSRELPEREYGPKVFI